MALIKCPECGKEISDKAVSCPQCGCPIIIHSAKDIKESDISEVTDDIPDVKCQIIVDETDNDSDEKNNGPAKKGISKKTKALIGIIAGFILIGGIVIFFMTENMRLYNKALELIDEKNYTEASKIFQELNDYKDSDVKHKECKFSMANDLFAQGNYEDAIKLYDGLGDYGDAETKSNESNYLIAKLLMDEEKYSEAGQIYSELGEYKNSKELYEKCNYEQTVDGKFMRALSKGLIDRWDYSETGYIEEFGKEVDKLGKSEYMEYIKKCINFELDYVGDFQEKEFLDVTLGEKVLNYIEVLNNGLTAIDYYSMDFNKYNVMWNDIYSTRVLFIRDFVNDYGLIVDEEHQKTLDELITDASIVDEQNTLNEAINNMVDGYTYEAKDDGYGNITYIVNMENTTNVTFEYFGCSVDVLDENETIISTGYTGEIKNFAPGQRAQLEVYTGVQGVSLKFHPNYYVEQ